MTSLTDLFIDWFFNYSFDIDGDSILCIFLIRPNLFLFYFIKVWVLIKYLIYYFVFIFVFYQLLRFHHFFGLHCRADPWNEIQMCMTTDFINIIKFFNHKFVYLWSVNYYRVNAQKLISLNIDETAVSKV